MKSTPFSSMLLIGAGIGIFAIAAMFVLSNPALSIAAAVLGIGGGAILAAPLVGTGLYLRNKAQGEAVDDAHIAKQRKLLNMLMTEKELDFRKIALEINVTRDQAREMVKDLISRGLFDGSVDWDTGIVYSKEAAAGRSFDHLAQPQGGAAMPADEAQRKAREAGNA